MMQRKTKARFGLVSIIMLTVAVGLLIAGLTTWYSSLNAALTMNDEAMDKMSAAFSEFQKQVQAGYQNAYEKKGTTEQNKSTDGKMIVETSYGEPQVDAITGRKYIPIVILGKSSERDLNAYSYSDKIYLVEGQGSIENMSYPDHTIHAKYDKDKNKMIWFVDDKEIPDYVQIPDYEKPMLIASTNKVGAIGSIIKQDAVFTVGSEYRVHQDGFLSIETQADSSQNARNQQMSDQQLLERQNKLTKLNGYCEQIPQNTEHWDEKNHIYYQIKSIASQLGYLDTAFDDLWSFWTDSEESVIQGICEKAVIEINNPIAKIHPSTTFKIVVYDENNPTKQLYTLFNTGSSNSTHSDTDVIPVKKGTIIKMGTATADSVLPKEVNIWFFPFAVNEYTNNN